MGWWSRARREKAEQWYAGPVAPGGVVPPAGPPLVGDQCYVHVFLESLYVSAVRRGLTRFYGTVTSTCSLPHPRGEVAESVVVTTPKGLKDADAAHLDRLIVDRTRLFGPAPYQGGDLEIEVGLFSTPATDLLAPFLSVVEDIAGLASAPFVQAAKPFVAPVKRGLGLLLGDTDGKSELEIGLTTLYAPPKAGWLAVARVPAGTGVLGYDGGQRLLTLDGTTVSEPHLVLSIATTTEREDWFMVPSLLEAWNDLKREAERQNLAGAKEALAAFRSRATFCPDLVSADAQLLVAKAEAKLKVAFPTAATAALTAAGTAAGAGPSFPELAALDLYDRVG